jgi:hypothetical protein
MLAVPASLVAQACGAFRAYRRELIEGSSHLSAGAESGLQRLLTSAQTMLSSSFTILKGGPCLPFPIPEGCALSAASGTKNSFCLPAERAQEREKPYGSNPSESGAVTAKLD